MQGILHEEASFLVFVGLTVVLGGGCAWLTGRAIALTWRPFPQVLAYCVLLGLALRFFHFALFDGTLLSLHYYLVDTAILCALGALGHRVTRTTQMVTQYPWLYRRTGPLSFADRADAPSA